MSLKRHVQAYPDAMLSERAQLFGVSPSAICYHLKQMKFSRKKNSKYQESSPFERGAFLREYRQLIKDNGKQRIVHVDECGFEPTTCRRYAWSARGQKVYGKFSGNKRPRTTLIAAKHQNRIIGTILFEGSTDAKVFNYWLQHHLLSELPNQTTIIMDNASFHKTVATRDIIRNSGNSFALSACLFTRLEPD